MHVAHITSHFASLDYSEVIRGAAERSHFAARVSHRRNRSSADDAMRAHRKAASTAVDAASQGDQRDAGHIAAATSACR
jgi:hypothetical protein